MKKVLIITYYWPPSGGAGVQRWLKFVKYFREFGWEPVVYIPENAEYPVLDDSLQKDVPPNLTVISHPIREPYGFFKKFTGKKKDDRVFNVFLQDKKEKNWKMYLALFIRANIFIPDARFLWIGPSVKFLVNYIKTTKIDLIVSTGPPHSTHLIAQKVKQKTNIPWLADFRDPWTNIDFADDLPFTTYAKKRNQGLESLVLRSADHIITVSDLVRQEFETKTNKPVSLITNGFDPEDFKIDTPIVGRKYFTLVHTGSLNNRRNHPALWRAIADLRNEDPQFSHKFRIRLIGNTDISALNDLKELDLMGITELIEYVPHDQIAREQLAADILLLPINRFGEDTNEFKTSKGTIPGKVFEYLACRKPILAIGVEDGQIDQILKETRAGRVLHFDDQEGIKNFIHSQMTMKDKGEVQMDISKYSRKSLTQRMAALFDQMIL